MRGERAEFWRKTCATALHFMAFTLPLGFYLRTYDAAAIKTATFQIGVLVMVFAWFLKGLELGRWELPRRTVPFIAPALAWMAWTALRFALTPGKAAALPVFLDGLLGPALFCVVLLEFGGEEDARSLFAWILRAAWLAGLYGAAQKLGLDPLIWKGAFGGRVFSTLGDPELFSTFLAFCLPLCLTRLFDPERAGAAWAGDLALAALAAANVSWTASALGLLAFAIQAAVFAGVFIPVWRARGSVYLAGLCSAVAGALLAERLSAPGWLIWPLAGMLGGLWQIEHPGGVVYVLPLPWGEGRRRLYAPVLLAFAGLAAFPILWLRSDVEHNIAVYHSRQRNWTEALAHYDRVRPGAAAYVRAQYLKGNVLLDLGLPAEALRQYALVESLSPDFARLGYQRGVAYSKVWDWDKALASHERQAVLDPADTQNLRSLTVAATVRGDLARARQAARQAIALEPGQPSNWQALSAVYLKEKKTAAARRILGEGRRLGLKFDKAGSNR